MSGDVPLGPGILRAEATFTPDAYRDVATPDGLGRSATSPGYR